jgi:hypothetical protein
LNNKKTGGVNAVTSPEAGFFLGAFGVRIPQKACWQHPEDPWNGDYLAVSLDHRETWRNVERITSGGLTTHYMAIAETPGGNQVYVSYDLVAWGTQEIEG